MFKEKNVSHRYTKETASSETVMLKENGKKITLRRLRASEAPLYSDKLPTQLQL